MTAVITLDGRLDFAAAPELKAEILGHIGHDLEINASGVAHLGTLCLQVLIAASKEWASTGQKFNLTSPSDICTKQLSLHGFSPDTLSGVIL